MCLRETAVNDRWLKNQIPANCKPWQNVSLVSSLPVIYAQIKYSFSIFYCVYILHVSYDMATSLSTASVTPTLKELSNALDSIVDWYSALGVKLELEDYELGMIGRNFHGDNERCKLEVLCRWRRNAKLLTWTVVADALCLMGEYNAALKIRAKHCSSSADISIYTRK